MMTDELIITATVFEACADSGFTGRYGYWASARIYTDLETAQHHAAYDYAQTLAADGGAAGALTWRDMDGWWELIDYGKYSGRSGIRIDERYIFGPTTKSGGKS